MLEKSEAGSGVLFPESDAVLFESGACFVEAAKLLFVEVGILGKGHHRALNACGLARSQIANEGRSVSIRHADAADASVNADVKWYGLLRLGRDFVQRGSQRRVDHGHDAAGDGIHEVLLVKGAHE